MSKEVELQLLRQLLDSRMRGLSVCNQALERDVPKGMGGLIESLRDSEAELISQLQKTIEAVMEDL